MRPPENLSWNFKTNCAGKNLRDYPVPIPYLQVRKLGTENLHDLTNDK